MDHGSICGPKPTDSINGRIGDKQLTNCVPAEGEEDKADSCGCMLMGALNLPDGAGIKMNKNEGNMEPSLT